MKTIGIAFLCVALGGCATPTPTPILDSHFGEAVRTARALQTLNPEASLNMSSVTGLDGQASKEAIARYQASFKTPPPSMNVINIGGSMTGGNK